MIMDGTISFGVRLQWTEGPFSPPPQNWRPPIAPLSSAIQGHNSRGHDPVCQPLHQLVLVSVCLSSPSRPPPRPRSDERRCQPPPRNFFLSSRPDLAIRRPTTTPRDELRTTRCRVPHPRAQPSRETPVPPNPANSRPHRPIEQQIPKLTSDTVPLHDSHDERRGRASRGRGAAE